MASSSLYDLSIEKINGKGLLNFSELRGKTLLLVNVASRCGFTKHYTGLEALNQKYASKGLVVIGFPSNQFGAQEPGTEEEIVQFCSLKYNVSFDLTKKIDVNGANTHPVYAHLKQATGGAEIGWNFEKFVVDKNGTITRFAAKTSPEDLDQVIAQSL
ncbi:thioredoxin-like protein [Obelidium mucronatum]|nr:thioredoxin-like protein [Obelidium mucronatum]